MGRFKIYDSKKLLKIENDSNYGKCLLCERKLKNIMGNIKRHYENMHSVFVHANGRKTKKCKRKSSKLKMLSNDSDKTNLFMHVETLDGRIIHKIDNTNSFQTATMSPLCTNQSHNLLNPTTQGKIQQSDQIIQTSAVNQQMEVESHKSNLPAIEEVNSDDITGTSPTSKGESKLIEEDDQIQIPCYSFINNIEINSVESCQQLEFLKCLVETKAHVNIPLKTFQNEDTFQNALKNWKLNFKFNYSPQTIGEHIDRMTKKMHQQIKKLAANRLIYLKLDVISNTEGNVMLVNIQFIKDFHLQVITLNALEFSDDDSAAYLKKKVMSTLERFRLDIGNAFAIIKDNTNNVRKCFKNSGKICDYPSNAEYCQHLSHGFSGHAIHYAASDIIVQLNENISQGRDSARNLQRQLLHLNSKSTILLDNNTNWFSVYDMMESLMNVHDEVETKNHLLIEVDWVFVKKFVESFKPVVETALMFQTNEIVVMGDFYREWLLCEMKLEELADGNEVALYLLKALHKRRSEYFENSSFLAALYMDPRFCYMGSMHLSDKQKEMAITQLLQIFNKLKAMRASATFPCPKNDRYDKLERQIVNDIETNIETTTNYAALSLLDIDEQRVKESLEQLQFEERLVLKTNILEYWNVAKYKTPVMAKLAEIALSAPATQATLSRALNASSMTLIKGKLKKTKENIENLLLLKLNQDLVDKISLQNQ